VTTAMERKRKLRSKRKEAATLMAGKWMAKMARNWKKTKTKGQS